MSKYAKLIMVTGNNNNKFYEMIWENGPLITVNYGRVEATSTTITKPIGQWDSIIREKLKKGYKDVTHTVSTVKTPDTDNSDQVLSRIDEEKVDRFLTLMKKYTDGLVAKTYTVKAKDVTQAQVDEAQKHLDDLKKLDKKDTLGINNKLLELYMVIPRFMRDVKQHLLPNIVLEKVLEKEQDNLDAMASQVAQFQSVKKKTKKKKEQNTLLDVLGISMREITGNSNIEYLTNQLVGKKIKGIFEINKPAHDEVFDNWMATQKNKQTRYLLHGTRCSSVIPIIEQGLKIRPTGNYQFSGKAYGDGNYFSETCSKSLNYTGYDQDKILFVYEVHTGNPYVYDGWWTGNSFSLTEKNLKERGFDSTFVKAGNGLLNTEIIAYKEEQCTLRYLIWL